MILNRNSIMNRLEWFSLLPALMSLLSVDDVCGSCGAMDPPCPPPFPDFMAFFAETLKTIPELLVENRTSLSTDCPESVNWTAFNLRLEYGSPLPLNPVCSNSPTQYPTTENQSNPYYVSSTSFGVPRSTKPSSTQGATVQPPISIGVKDPDETPNIGLPVGVAVGGAVLILVIVIIVAVCVRRLRKEKKAKDDLLQRFQSTTSHDVLVTDLDIPDTPQVHQTVITLRDSTFLESSTDATIRKPTADSIDVVITEKKVSDEDTGGCDNKAFDAVEEEIEEDPGYAGSEACQENWENEWNNKFEEALMESNDTLPEDAEDADIKGETSSDPHKKKKLASRVSNSSTSKNLHMSSSTKPTSSPFDSPSTSKSSALGFRMPFPTRSAVFSTDSSLSSQFSRRPSATNWPTSVVDDVATSSKPSFDRRTPSLTPSSDGPPAYSSPVIIPNGAPPFRLTKLSTSFEDPTPPVTPMTPSELPTYTEVMAARDPPPSSSHPETTTTSPPKQQKPPPAKHPKLAKAAAMPPSTPLKSQSVESSVEEKPNPWKIQAKGNGKTNNKPEKPANTAVVRPWTGSKGQASDGRQQRAVPSTPASTPASTPVSTPASTPRADAAASATEATSSDSVGEYSFRPVRSLLSQFETLDRNKP